MKYSIETKRRLKNVAKQQNITLAELDRVLAYDRATGKGSLENQLVLFAAEPDRLTRFLDEYNRTHEATPVVQGAAQKTRHILLGVAVLVALVGGYFLYKKLK